MPGDFQFYLFALPAVLLIGLAKGGFTGLGALGTPLMALALDNPVKAAAVLLPILIAQDAVAIAAFRKGWDASVLRAMLPGAIVGIGLGYLLAARVSANVIMAVLGAISISFGAYRLWVERHGAFVASSRSPQWVGSLFGVVTGFTSQIAHAGGPPFQMWVMPRKLPRDVLIGTSAVFFAIINWVKVPAYAALGQFTLDNARLSALLLPVAVVASLLGVRLVRRVSVERFYVIVYALMVVAGMKLLLDGLGVG